MMIMASGMNIVKMGPCSFFRSVTVKVFVMVALKVLQSTPGRLCGSRLPAPRER